MATEKFLPYGHQSINTSDVQAVEAALRSDVITRGKNVEAFEQAVATFTDAKYAVAFCNGSVALFAAYQSLGACRDDTLFTSPNTFIATAAPAKKLGVQVEYVDIDRYGNGDFIRYQDSFNAPRSRGRVFITPVHFSGVAIDMQALSSTILRENIAIIEDAAHAFGSFYPNKRPVGSCDYSDMTVFSFHPVKNITTGEGGMVTTNSEKLYQRLLLLRNSGIQRQSLKYTAELEDPSYYEVHELSCNYHMSELQAALGLSQLKRIDDFRAKKKQIMCWYRKFLRQIPGIELPPDDVDERTLYHLFVLKIGFRELDIDRKTFMKRLEEVGVGSQFHYVPLYNHPSLGSRSNEYRRIFPNMERHFEKALSIPFFVDMEEEDVKRVAVALRKAILT